MTTRQKRRKRLDESIQFYSEAALHAAAISANEACSEAQRIAPGGSGEQIAVATAVEKELREALPKIFAAYSEERGGIIGDDHELKGRVTSGIADMFDSAHLLLPDLPEFGATRQLYRAQIDEAGRRAAADAEEHFRRPGLRPMIHRFPVQASVISFFGGLVISRLVDVLLQLLRPA